MCLPKRVSGAAIQSVATAIGNLLCFNFGLIFGITPAHMALYESEKLTPLNEATDPTGSALLTGYLFLSAAVGAAVSGWLALRIGPKSVLLCCGLLQIFGWFCIHFGFDIVHIYASRIFCGIAAGGAFVVLPIFINEIAESRDKAARLTFTIELWRTLGILFGILLGYYVQYQYVNIIGCIASCAFSLCFPFVQESPHYYLRKGNVPCLEKSLRWYRGIRDIDDREQPEYLQELAEFKAELKQRSSSKNSSTELSHGYIVRLIFVSFLLTVCAKLSGVFVELNYAADFLGRTGYSIEVNYVVLASAQCVGGLLARLFGPQLPRKLLLCLSSLLAAAAVIALALFKQFGHNWTLGDWCTRYLPIVLLGLQLLFVSFGLYPLAAVVSSEVLPTKLHDLLYSIASACAWLLLFGMIEGFNAVKTSLGPGLLLYLLVFAAASIFVGLISLPLLPETRNRRASAVQRDLGYVEQAGPVAKTTDAMGNGHVATHI
ncbi:facilitated trehalose transporter Tret1 [Drosophila albomicans]|uniref:Facilitated trehalose transporter Tret1 n=1 Tax=Drosophila albomicans TaxID=7291 RepID=A0A6P8ZGD4_DROAB|nr:facilitated trehalose transporter Tret1 [Drosophila albomicans]XP_034119707.1 facilitated trehalose transporter Tret1 [Drosophila albomicans]